MPNPAPNVFPPLLRSVLLACLLALACVARPAGAQDSDPVEQLPDKPLDQGIVRDRVYRMNHHHLLQGMRHHVESQRKAEREQRAARRRRGAKARGSAPRPAPAGEIATVAVPRRVLPAAPSAAQALPANVRANDPAGDNAGVAQSELSIAAIGDEVVVGWNDGMGFASTLASKQGLAISADGGAAFADAGGPPVAPGFTRANFLGDPVVAADEKNRRFYVAGLAQIDRDELTLPADSSALMVARRFDVGGTWTWMPTSVPRALSSTNYFLDKEWLAADSTNGNVYLVYTLYDFTGNTCSIQFQRSLNTATSWTVAVTLSSAADAGDVQGARVATGPNGAVHVAWMHNNPATGLYDIRYRRSTDGGATFGAEQTVATHVPLAGTGPPGFNRSRGLDNPGLAVDRTGGLYRGRVYVSFSEAYDYLDDLWASQPFANTVRFESENNNACLVADAFTAGQTLRGSVGATGDAFDVWAVPLTAGQHLIVWFDSTTTAAVSNFYFHSMGPDTTTRLAYGWGGVDGDLQFIDCMYTFYAPVTGTYYLKVQSSLGSKAYRVRTKIGATSGSRSRDRRDPWVAWSQGGAGGWSAPVRVNDSPVGSDDFLPEIAVGPDGCPYVAWYDARDDADMAATHVYTARSLDGGGSWTANQRLSDAATDFTTAPANIMPNMGDYIGLTSGPRRVHVAWGDGRGADVDAYTGAFVVDAGFTSCFGDAAVPALGSATLSSVFRNDHAFAPETFTYQWSDERGWLAPQPSSVPLAPGQSAPLEAVLTVPADAAGGTTDRACLTVTNPTGAIVRTCCATITVRGSLVAAGDGGAEFGLGPATPSPAHGATTLRYGLPASGRVSLAIFDVRGARVRTLVDEVQRAGSHTRVWDGRDDEGRSVPAGVYFSRLQHGGRQAEGRIVMLE